MVFTSVSTSSPRPYQPQSQPDAKYYEREAQQAQITAIALSVVALVLYSSALVFYGLGTFPPPAFAGLEFIAMFTGSFISFVALGVLLGSTGYAFSSAYQIQQKGKQANN